MVMQYFTSYISVLTGVEKMVHFTGASLGFIIALCIWYIFGVPRFKDPLILTYKKNSKIINKILGNTELKNMCFKTCWAGTVT